VLALRDPKAVETLASASSLHEFIQTAAKFSHHQEDHSVEVRLLVFFLGRISILKRYIHLSVGCLGQAVLTLEIVGRNRAKFDSD
jgi:hypothetical protein